MAECVTRWKDKHLHLFEEATRAKLLGQGKLWTGAELDKILQEYTVSTTGQSDDVLPICPLQAIEDIPFSTSSMSFWNITQMRRSY
jgi:hypothetical protein